MWNVEKIAHSVNQGNILKMPSCAFTPVQAACTAEQCEKKKRKIAKSEDLERVVLVGMTRKDRIDAEANESADQEENAGEQADRRGAREIRLASAPSTTRSSSPPRSQTCNRCELCFCALRA